MTLPIVKTKTSHSHWIQDHGTTNKDALKECFVKECSYAFVTPMVLYFLMIGQRKGNPNLRMKNWSNPQKLVLGLYGKVRGCK